jgi:hypothetical protein
MSIDLFVNWDAVVAQYLLLCVEEHELTCAIRFQPCGGSGKGGQLVLGAKKKPVAVVIGR